MITKPKMQVWRYGQIPLLLGLVLVACGRSPQPGTPDRQVVGPITGASPYAGGASYPWGDRVEVAAPGSNPYLGGRSYPWVGVQGSGTLGKLAAADTFLSDLSWTTATNAWGPAEKDASNGEQLAGDGQPITIGGQVFNKGLGVHAGSELQYTLGGGCTVFSAWVGLDDEVGNQGSVSFQIWNGGTRLYDSGVRQGSDSAQQVSLDVGGVQTLRLVVTGGGDNIDYDHADWGDARVSCQSSTPTTGVNSLSDLGWLDASNGWGPLERDQSNGEQLAGDGQPITIGGVVFARGLGTHAGSQLSYTLAGRCSTFTAQVGLDDEVGDRGSVNFQVWTGAAGSAGTTLLYDSGVRQGSDSAQQVSLDVGGVQTLRLVVTGGGDNIDYDHADWGDARVSCGPVSAFGTTLDYQSAAAQPYGVSEAQGLALNGQLYVFGGFDVLRGYTPTDRAYRYDPAQNSWTALATMPTRGVTNAGMTTDETALYYAGGYTADSGGYGQVFGTRAVWRYDLSQNTYRRLPDLPTECAAGQLKLLDGQLHYFGGLNLTRTQDLTTHYVLDLVGGATSWRLAAPLPLGRNQLGSAVLNGKIYAIGGQTGYDDQLTTHREVFAYDPAQDRWAEVRSLPFGRSHIGNSTFVMGGRIVVAGGETAHTVPTTDVSAYDPVHDTWTALTPLPEARTSGVAGAISDQQLVFTSGFGSWQFQASGWVGTLQ